MQVSVGYGRDEKIELEIEQKNLLGVFEPNVVPKTDCHRCLVDALAAPLGRSSFDDFIAGDERIVVIVNDGTLEDLRAKVATLPEQLRNLA